MPAFVIAQGSTGQPADALLCDPGAIGLPDKKTAVPVRIHLVFDHIVSVDAENRSIISTVGEN
jgi:hypothetical protein